MVVPHWIGPIFITALPYVYTALHAGLQALFTIN